MCVTGLSRSSVLVFLRDQHLDRFRGTMGAIENSDVH